MGAAKGGGKGRQWSHNGKAVVVFDSAAAAKKAIKDMNKKELDGRELELDTWTEKEGAKPRNDDKPSDPACMVYVKNVSWKTRGWKLKEHFEQAGTVVHYKQMNERGKQW